MPRTDDQPAPAAKPEPVEPQGYPVPVVIKDPLDYLEKFIDPKLNVIIRLLQELKK